MKLLQIQCLNLITQIWTQHVSRSTKNCLLKYYFKLLKVLKTM